MTVPAQTNPAAGTAGQVDGGGTMWRLRSLVAMGHDATRIARALRVHPQTVQDILRGDAVTVTSELRGLAQQLWDAWWDKRPPEQTRSQRRTAAGARRQAERCGWCPPLGLDEDELDEPGYRPYSRYRAATGTGIAGEFLPHSSSAGPLRAPALLYGSHCGGSPGVATAPTTFAHN
jgi:hypothetical protein